MKKIGQYYHYNGHGDVTQLTDQSGNIVASYVYDAWGNILQSSGTMANSNPYRYAGYRYDSETGPYYLNARYYNPANGVFLSVHPEPGSADDPLNLNPYIYTRNNPVIYADPDGKWIVDAIFLVADVATFAANPSLAGAGWIAADAISFADPTGAASTIAHAGKAAKVAEKGALLYKGVRKVAGKARAVCFTGDTLIYTENGHKLIKDIQVGDEVYSENPETGEKGLKKVVQVFVNEADTLIHLQVGHEEIKTTPSHPFWVVGRGWVEAGTLKAGDKLQLNSGQIDVVQAIQSELLENPVKVYNFEVEDWHTYYVSSGGVLVHNMCALDFGSWGKDGFSSAVESALHHFEKHGAEVGAADVQQYIRKAEEFKKNLRGAKKSPVPGTTEGVIRYKKNGKYIDLAPDKRIIYFGRS